MKRVVIKVGSGIVYGRSGHFAATRFRAIASQIEWLTKNRVEPILVVSGAVALGARMCEVHDEDSRRYAAALGTSTLTRGVDAALRIRKLRAAHFLIAADSEAELHRPDLIVKGIESCLNRWAHVPVLNGNDATSAMINNDVLAIKIATLIRAAQVVILTTARGSPYSVGGAGAKEHAKTLAAKAGIPLTIVDGTVRNALVETVL